MSKIKIRKCTDKDKNEILNICYKTGYMGDDLTGRNTFNDKTLFGYLFCDYYSQYEPEHCFVAFDTENNNKIVGYLLGTLDTDLQQKRFILKMGWKIFLRMFSVTFWKHSESFRNVINFIKKLDMKDEPKNLCSNYPAHLHINILYEYQYFGIGSKLMTAFEEHAKKEHVKGIHLRTSNYNIKALPFYYKKGYSLLYEKEGSTWIGVEDYNNLIFGKELI